MDDRAIAIFDSGLGGLTALAALRRRLPGESIVFFGDSARAPYGSRTREELVKMSLQDLNFVSGFDVKAVLIACGTSSSNAMEELKNASAVPVIGVIDSAAERAAALAMRGRIGVIATEATIRSGAYVRALERLAPEAEIIARACPSFVPLVESGKFGGGFEEARTAVRQELAPFREAGVDVLLLGCTHYPLLSAEISEFLPDTVLVSNSEEAAGAMAQLLRESDALSAQSEGKTRFFTSGDAQLFRERAAMFLGRDLGGTVEGIEPFEI
jgi:glutamate racemase